MIEKVLIANRGEIARRIQRTCREMGIATVAIYSDDDRDAPFVREADEAVALGGSEPRATYLRQDAVLEAAHRTHAQAIHPGYGFLAENASFAGACADAGVVFLGPSAEVVRVMGSKIEARARMEAAGVPIVPGATLDADGTDAAGLAETIGYPILVKASAGGGGKGMRVLRSPEELRPGIEAAMREAASAFGDDTVFLERYVDRPRHVEVQIFGDRHGNVIHLWERECSIQRRHQKIVEESPSPGIDDATRERICAAAVRAGEAIGYEGAGTVEFLVGPDGEFYFLEVNTRLQVEHPVTEETTGIDLVRWQIEVAEGKPLPKQEDVPAARGHAIEARLYAEDPQNDYLPSTGLLHAFAVPATPGIRLESGVEAGSTVSVHYDPMLAKVIAAAPTRNEAIRRLARALERTIVEGVVTNRELLIGVLRHPEFRAGRTDTHFLERHPASGLAPHPPRDVVEDAALAAALHLQWHRRQKAPVLADLPSGWRNAPSRLQEEVFELGEDVHRVGYRWERGGWKCEVNGRPRHVFVAGIAEGHLDLEVDGLRSRWQVVRGGGEVVARGRNATVRLRRRERFPASELEEVAGSLVAPMPGLVRKVLASVGQKVEKGDVLLLLEAMKMEQSVTAPVSGTVIEIRASEGEQVEAGLVLAVIE